ERTAPTTLRHDSTKVTSSAEPSTAAITACALCASHGKGRNRTESIAIGNLDGEKSVFGVPLSNDEPPSLVWRAARWRVSCTESELNVSSSKNDSVWFSTTIKPRPHTRITASLPIGAVIFADFGGRRSRTAI